MDVDNLGKLFSNIDDYKNLAKLSYDLNYFFKVILNRICEGDFEEIKEHFEANDFLLKKVPARISEDDNKKERTVSVVYAGGDDLFIVGAWNEVAELGFDIQKCFDQYCRKYGIKNNEGRFATISGGLTLHHPKFPLYQMAERSGDAEKEAKNGKEKTDSEPKKNRIALFYDEIKEQRHQRLKKKHKEDRYMLSMSWETAHTYLLPLMNSFAKLGQFKEQGNGRKTFVMDKISYQTIEKWFLVTEKYQRSGELYLPTMARIMKDVQMNLNRQNKSTFFDILMRYLYNNARMSDLHIALNWLSFLRRTR
jgi:CRISPR-associated protein Csm1